MKRYLVCFCVLLCMGCGLFGAKAGDTAAYGMHHTLSTLYYIDRSGTVKTWAGQGIPLPGRAVDISASEQGASVVVALEDGSVYAWGRNDDGQLGLGDTQNHETPVKIPGLEQVISVSLGRYAGTNAAVTSDGAVYVWGLVYCGDDDQYQPILERYLTPQRVDGIANAISVSAGGNGFAVLCTDGSVYTWGMDDGGSNGYGEPRNSAVPVKLPLPPVRAVSRGWPTAAAVTMDGDLYTWGSNESGLLGYVADMPDNYIEYTPTQVDVEPMCSVCVGRSFYIAALAQRGAIYQWGSTQQDVKEPTPVTDSRNPTVLDESVSFVQVALGQGQSAGVTADGKLYAWGYNFNGELGVDADTGYVSYPTFVSADAMTPGTLPDGSLDSLSVKQRSYTADTFTDVDEDAWYGLHQTGTIALAYEYALVDGTGNRQFSPTVPLRVCEAIRLACSLQDRYAGGTGAFTGSGAWYQPYIHHAVTVGIFQPGDFPSYNIPATRAQMAYLFAHALPASELQPIHADISIPDVADSTPYDQELRTLYRAGVLTGVDAQGSFDPDRTITRAEATAIFLRLAEPDTRIHESPS